MGSKSITPEMSTSPGTPRPLVDLGIPAQGLDVGDNPIRRRHHVGGLLRPEVRPSSRSRTMTSARVPWRFREKKVSWSMASIIRFSTSHGNGGSIGPHRHAAQPELAMISSAERAWFPVTSTVRMVRDPTPNSTRHSTSPASRAYRFRNRQRKKAAPAALSPLFETPPLGQSLQLPGLMGGGFGPPG